MPVEERGILFRHFEKIICAVVALVLVLSLLFSAKQARRVEIAGLSQKIVELEKVIEPLIHVAPPEEHPKDYLAELEKFYNTQATMPEARIDPTMRSTVSEQPSVWVAPDKDYTIAFPQPLDAGSVQIRGGADIVASFEHPVAGDYSKVKIHTGKEGLVTISAVAGESRILQPVKVDRRAGMRAEPPLKLTAQSKREGVQLRFEPNPPNQKSVIVASYEIYRTVPRDAGAKFELVATVPVKDFELSEEARKVGREAEARRATAAPAPTAPMGSGEASGGVFEGLSPEEREMIMRQMMRGPTTPPARTPGRVVTPPAEEKAYSWLDTKVKPDEVYLYKVCTVAMYSFPPKSEFTEEIKVETLPLVDFRCKGGVAPNVRFEVAVYENGGVRRATFVNSVGDEIGGVQEDKQTGTQRNFLTGCQLVDYHPMVKRILQKKYGNMTVQTPVNSSRVIFTDRRGNVQTRWQDESSTDDLWAEKPTAPKRATTAAPMKGLPPESYELKPY